MRDGKGTVYDIEMQVTDTKELPKRSRYYQSMIDLQMIDRGQSYKKLKPSYIIFICPFDIFDKGKHIYTFENICKEDNSVSLEEKEVKKNREWRHEYMTLLMRDQENIEKGLKRGISGAISMCRDLRLSDDEIIEKLQDKFNLSREEAEQYMLDSDIK